MKCCVCGSTIIADYYFTPHEAHPDHVFCDDCYRLFRMLTQNPSEEQYNRIDALFSDFARNNDIPAEVRSVYRAADDAYWARRESVANYAANYSSAVADLLLTTGSHFDGYKVAKYLDIISCEIVFKHSLMRSLSSSFSDFISMMSFSEKELKGDTALIERAKEYVMDKFRKKAVDMGANGVLGIDFETTLGSEIVRISVNGTAVVVDKID